MFTPAQPAPLDNAENLREAFAPYLGAARKVGGPGRTRRSTRGRSTRERGGADTGPTPQTVRAWAAEHGIELKSRGRVPADAIAKYEAAQG
ncbi:Lsr2 family DNA-binding protein [Vallicoccus soli]|uniref:Lsr2 family DNA-binding protein n=1 Tax=Vallicoccus soli TaxID=2339232 RepID=UPI0014042483|nr:histone-like nucleoid-structuring protein Lsr2 [Vallicoccus soli]